MNPKCEHENLVEIETESTWTLKKYFCPKCGRPYGVVTKIGKTAQIAGIVTASVILTNFAMSIFHGDAESIDLDINS
ncbi:MAG: hypothetical protein U0X91_04370 [Spirosomataceae bacterium]